MDWKTVKQVAGVEVETKEEMLLPLFCDGFLKLDDDGRIWKCKILHRNGKTSQARYYDIEPRRCESLTSSGYYAVTMRIVKYSVKAYSHRLIWTLLRGPIPAGQEVNHKDLDKTNNRIENLELVTASENTRHFFETAQPCRAGERSARAKLKQADVDTIRQLCAEGMTHESAAKLYGVGRRAVGDICNYKTWRSD